MTDQIHLADKKCDFKVHLNPCGSQRRLILTTEMQDQITGDIKREDVLDIPILPYQPFTLLSLPVGDVYDISIEYTNQENELVRKQIIKGFEVPKHPLSDDQSNNAGREFLALELVTYHSAEILADGLSDFLDECDANDDTDEDEDWYDDDYDEWDDDDDDEDD